MRKKEKRLESESSALRQRAERALSRRPSTLSVPTDLWKLVQDLEVYQIELEMQNDELRQAQRRVQEARDRYADLYNFTPAGYFTLDRKGVIQEANLQAAILLGIPRGDLLRQPLVRYVVPAEQVMFAYHCKDVFLTGKKQSCDLRFLSPGGAPLFLHLDSHAFPHAKTGALTFCRTALFDITKQKEMAEERDRLASGWRLLLESTGEGIFGVDQAGRFTFINKAGAEMLGCKPEELLGKPMHELVHFRRQDGTPYTHSGSFVYRAYRNGESTRGEDEVFWRTDGMAIPIAYSCYPLIERGTVTGAVVVFTDVSQRRQAEKQLQDTLERVRILSQRLDAVREDERTRIARELHDELGVRLTYIKLQLARLHTLPEGALFPRELMEERILSMTDQVDTTIADLQRLVTELRPGVLDDLGLVAAIEWQSRDFERRSGIRCVCEAEQEEIELDHTCATAAFRICQEALTNVMRHAKATSVRVLLAEENGDLLLEIHDDGQGISPAKLTDSTSFGLLGMRERANRLGGQVEIAGRPGKGTTVRVRLRRLAATSLSPPFQQADMGDAEPRAAGSENDGFVS